MTWQSFGNGKRWRYLDDRRIELEDGITYAKPTLARTLELDACRCPRTRGEPKTARLLFDDFGAQLLNGARLARVPREWLAALMLCESVVIKGTLHRNPKSVRREPGYVSDLATPRLISAGLAQHLLSTAQILRDRHDDIARVAKAAQRITREDLFDPELSILLGALYLATLMDRAKHFDGPIGQAAYNAGGAYVSNQNPYRLRMYDGASSLIKFCAWNNDVLAVLAERGIAAGVPE